MRKIIFANEEYYHIYNRGVDKREVFCDQKDYERFLESMQEFNREDPIGSLYEKYLREKKRLNPHNGDLASRNNPLVEMVAYCLNPNHFHLILKQLTDKGISKFMLKLSTGYTAYFNQKNKRSGSLFQGPFKAIHIDSNEYLLHLSVYVNKNNFIHGYGGLASTKVSLIEWPYSSYLDYIRKRNGKICNKNAILSQFRSSDDYEKFVEKNSLHVKEKKELEKYLLE